MNKIILLGRLTKDVETRYTQNTNTLVSLFTLAVNRRFVKEGEEKQADFINIIAYGKTGEFINKYFKKGQQVLVSGRLQIRNYEDENGHKKYITEVIAEEVYFADSKKDSTNDLINILTSPTPVNTTKQEENFDDDLPF